MIDRALLLTELDRFARRLITEYPVSDALHDLVDATVSILDLHGAGTSLVQDDRIEFATATPTDIRELERVQERDQVGPCIEACRSGGPILVADVTREAARWPGLAEAAMRMGVAAVASVPMQLNGTRLGALGLYDARPRTWSEDEVRTAELLSALAAAYIANATHLDRLRQTTEQLQEALDSRVVIEQAKGVLAGERGISIDHAFRVIRAHARNHGAPLTEVAHAIVELGMRP